MNYEDLRRIQRLEKASSKLLEIHEDFYNDLKDYKQTLDTTKDDLESLKFVGNFEKIAKDVYERREQKIVRRALGSVRSDSSDEENLVGFENQMYNELVETLRKYRDKFFDSTGIVEEKVFEEKEEEKLEEKKKDEKTEELLMIHVSKDIPQFITSEGKFGPFKKEEEVSLPKKICNILEKKGYGKVI